MATSSKVEVSLKDIQALLQDLIEDPYINDYEVNTRYCYFCGCDI